MKPNAKRPSKTMKANKKKSNIKSAGLAIGKKVEEIKRENSMSQVVNNNLSLFRYLI
ncbi:MAG TPA: hypothetical protein VM012_03885 [Flavitalea sp.]|nr:hypothetical protein [Flavitalea sp.]